MLTYRGYRYNGPDQNFIKALMEDLARAQEQVRQLLAQSKKETRIKP